MKLTRIATAALFALASTSVLAQQAAPLKNDVFTRVDAMYPWLDTIYKDLHAHPEIAFQETRTAGKLAAEMRKLGFTVTEKVGKTGIVAVLKNGAGPTVLVRTDMDGLPMEEKTGLPYASRARAMSEGRDTFVTHSCGHDIHMSSWLGAARTLVELKSQWKGTLVFIGQPAEEIVSGARAMLDDGLFKRFPKPDYAFALHSWPLAYGTVGFNDGPVSSNSDSLEIVFKGRGGHGSAPDKTVDPIAIAARFVVDVQTVVSREKDPKEFGVVTVGAIQGGTVGNIIPDSVQVRGTIRSYSPQVRARLLDGVRRVAEGAAAMAGAPKPDMVIGGGGQAIVNSTELVNKTEVVFKEAFGADKAVRMPAMTASEDFSLYANEGVPSMFFFTGVYDPKDVAAAEREGGKPIAFNHSPFYAPVPEPSIKTSAKAMTLAVLNVLGK
ncbi:amidohydrolase [Massilia sp. YIM B02443]|uniref:amidohydrolase n=1 Tax=Massilia sp. YIM B02443 TaxID=3050127 RepID=UPI0025B6AC0E|nr:amidohydrolase [Massilia sp. YIM B02443]MDN4040270.1 amidohydrolase [Massilia sp. YIM B02443]